MALELLLYSVKVVSYPLAQKIYHKLNHIGGLGLEECFGAKDGTVASCSVRVKNKETFPLT